MGTPTLNSIPFKSPEDLREYVVFDLETTGLYPKTCQIIQLAAVTLLTTTRLIGFLRTLIRAARSLRTLRSSPAYLTRRWRAHRTSKMYSWISSAF